MQWATLAAIYFIAWWIMLFAVLPLGVESQGSQTDGTDPGAPIRPRLAHKAAITTVLAIPAAALIYWFIRFAV